MDDVIKRLPAFGNTGSFTNGVVLYHQDVLRKLKILSGKEGNSAVDLNDRSIDAM